MIQATQMKRGMCIKHDNDLYRVVSAQHITPGNWRGMVQAKIRHLKSGSIIEHRFRSEDRIERAILDDTEMQFLYRDGDMYHFMNQETYEQIGLSDEVLGDAVPYLIPDIVLKVELYEGRPVGIELPLNIDMTVVETEPAINSTSWACLRSRASGGTAATSRCGNCWTPFGPALARRTCAAGSGITRTASAAAPCAP